MNILDQLLSLKADGHLALLTFEASETSKLTRRFIDALATLLTTGARKPLICSTDRQLLAIFKATVSHAQLTEDRGQTFRSLLKFSDAKSLRTITFTTDAEAIPLGGTWVAGRTPESTYRHELGVFDGEAVSRALRDLLSQWETAGDLVPPQSAEELRAQFRATQPKMPTLEEMAKANSANDPGDWDIADPRRTTPGLVAAVRKYRAEQREQTQVKPRPVSRFFGMGGG